MSNITWKPNANGYWSTAADWSGGVEPGAADYVTLTSTGTHTIYFTVSDTVAGLTSTDDLLNIESGDLTVSGLASLAGGLAESGAQTTGTLTLLGTSNSINGAAISAGDILLGTAAVLTLSGSSTFGTASSTYGAHIHGAGTLDTIGKVTIANGGGGTDEAWFGAGLVWNNTGTVTDAGLITAFYTPGNAFTINNEAGGVFAFSTDIACIMNGTVYDNYHDQLTAGSSFVNAGLLEKTGGTGTTTFYANLNSTGTIDAASGTLALNGGGVIGGKVDGQSTLYLAGGDFVLAAGLAEGAGALELGGAAVTLGGNLTPTGAVDLLGGILELNAYNLTAASATLDNGTLDGAGTLTTSGTTDEYNFYVGGGADWVNAGTVDEAGAPLYLADGNGYGTLTNLAGATYDFTDGNGVGYFGNSYGGTLINAGTLEETGGDDISIYPAVVDTGVVDAAYGSIQFDGGGSIGGTLEGAGQIAFGQYYGYYTLAANTGLAVASLLIDYGNVTLDGSFNYTGNLAITGGGIELNGFNFTVASPYLYNGYVDGAGTFSTSGTLSTGNFTAGGGADWVNSGTINESGSADTIADGNGNGTLTNLAGATFNFNDDSGLSYSYYVGGYIGGVFNNAGTLAKIGGTNTSQFYATINNTGTINVATGTMQFDGGGTIAGDVTGAGTVAFGNNAQGYTTYATLASGTTLSVAGLYIAAGVLTIENSYNYTGALSMTGGILELNGYNFSDAANYLDGGTVDGSGTFYTSGTTSTQYFSVGGGADWVNSGTVYETLYDYLSDGDGAGTITNLVGATFAFTNINGYGIQPNGSVGTFINAGTLTTSGTGAAPGIYAVINSTGTISAASGTTLQFEDGGSISGALTGAGNISFGAYNNLYNYTLAAGTSLIVSNLEIDGGILTLNSSYTYSGFFDITSGALELNGYNFSSASPYLSGGTIDGTGIFSTSGAIELPTNFQNFYVGGGADWINSGTITESNGYVYLDDGNGAGTLTNQAGAVYDFTQNYYGIFNSSSSGTFINAGLIEDTGSPSSFTYFQATAESTGTISVVTAGSTLDFDNGGTFAGQINGKGAVEFDGGVNFGNLTIAATTGLILNAGVNMVGNATIASSFQDYTYIALNGDTLTLSGTDVFGYAAPGTNGAALFDGTSSVTTTGNDSVNDNASFQYALLVGGGAEWNNAGKISDAGAMQLGYYDGTGTIANAGVFDFTSDDGQIYNGYSYDIYGNQDPVIGTFINSGTLAKTAGSLTNYINATLISTGTISTNGGTLAFADGGTLGGKILAGSHVQLVGGDFIINGLTEIGFLTDFTQIDQTGSLAIGSGSTAGYVTVDGIYNIDGNETITSAVTTSSITIVSGGTLAKTGGTGTASIGLGINDGGVILAEAGKLLITGAIGGAGTATISNGASLELGGTVGGGIIVTMGTSDELLIDQPANFKGKISNFVVSDTIDLGSLTVTGASASSNGLMTLKNGASTVGTLTLTSNPTGDVFSYATDGHGGTLLEITKSGSNWTGGTNDWTVSSAWSAGVPGPTVDATIAGTAAETVTIGEADAAHSLTLSDAKATLDLDVVLGLTTTFAQAAGTVEMGGTVNGGTIDVTGGDFAVTDYSGTQAFNNVLFEGALDLSQVDSDLYANGSTFTGVGGSGPANLNITGNAAGLYEEGISTINSAVVSLGNAGGYASLLAYDNGDNGALLTLGTAVIVTQTGLYADIGDSGYDTDGIFNSGAITGAVNGGTLEITGNLFENDGVIKISNGDTLDITATTFTNNGTLSISGSTLILDSMNTTQAGQISITNSTIDLGGSLSTGQFSGTNTVNLSGTLNNTGVTLNLSTGTPISSFTLDGGTIVGGTVIAPVGGLAVVPGSSGTPSELLDVTEDGALALTSGALELQGSTIDNAAGTAPGAISVANTSIEFDGYASINNNISLSGGTLFVTGESLSTNLSTGVDASGNPLTEGSADPHWADSYTGGQATVLSEAFWIDNGVPLNTAANMIGVYDSTSEPPPPYTFTETFTLTAAQAASAVLTGLFFVDNGGSLVLNGNTLDSYADNLVPVGVGAAGDFQAGVNTLTIELTVGDQSYDGAYFDGGIVTATTIAAGTTVQGTGEITDEPTGDGASAVVNDGVIAANVSGGVLEIAPTLFDNQATVTASAGATLQINATDWANSGIIAVNNATLDLGGSFATSVFAGITITNGGVINVTGTLNNTGATLSVGTGTSLGMFTLSGGEIEGGIISDAGNGIFENVGTLSDLTYEGILNIGANQEFIIQNGLTVTGANGVGSGTINITGSGSWLELDGSLSLNGFGAINLTGANSDLFLDDYSTLANGTLNFGGANSAAEIYLSSISFLPNSTIGTNFDVLQSASNSSVTIDLTAFQTQGDLVNLGTIAASAKGGSFAIYSTNAGFFTNGGIITVSNGDTLSLADLYDFTNLYGYTLTGGTYSVGANSLIELADYTSIVTDAADIILSGTASNIQAYNGASQITLDATLATIAAGGTLALSAGRTWNSALAMTDAGDLSLSGTSFKAASLTVAAGGIVIGNGTLTNTIANSGLIEASGGTLTITALTGTGNLKILSGAKLDLTGAAAATQTISLAGDPSTLLVGSPSTFKAVLGNVGAGDTIDFTSLAGATATISGTTLTVKEGSTAYSFTINSLAAGTVFTTGTDGHSGTDITFYRQAVPGGHRPEPVAFGEVHEGATLTQDLTIANIAAADGYSEALDATIANASSLVTASGSILRLAAGGTNSTALSVSLADRATGTETGTAVITLDSDGTGIDGFGTTALGTQTVNLSATVFAYATAATAASLNFGIVHVGQTVTQDITLANSAAAGIYSENLDAAFSGTSADFFANGSVSELAAGASNTSGLVVTIQTGTAGVETGSTTLSLVSDGSTIDTLGTTVLAGKTVTLTGTVDNYASLALHELSGAGTLTSTLANNYTLNLGSVLESATALTADLEVLNSAAGLSDLLSGSFTVASANAAFTNTGIGTFSGLGAGAADTSPVFTLATGTAGTETEVLVIDPAGSNASGYSGTLSPVTLTITGIVADVFTLTTGVDDFVGGPGNDLFIAASGDLSAGDILNGGAGSNTLSLSGGGIFDTTQPATFTSIQSIVATEATGNAAQTVYLRSGYTGMLTAASGAPGAGITIHGNADSATIQLGNGNDTVFVGSNTETISSGTGNSVFNVTSATSAAKITAGGGANTLAVSGGGTVTMGAAITGVNIAAINDSGVTGTSFIANSDTKLVIDGGAGADTITLGAATQNVVAGSGTTLIKGVIGDAGALITSNSLGTSTLDLTTGGTGTLNAADTELTVTLSTATNLTLSKMGFITVDGSAGNDTLTALAANQTLTPGLGTDTLIGYSGFGDLFKDTAAGLNGDTIFDFGGNDLVDLTNVNSSMVTSLGWTQSGTGGTLRISDGTNTASILFSGTYTAASFTFGADGSLGTYIHFV